MNQYFLFSCFLNFRFFFLFNFFIVLFSKHFIYHLKFLKINFLIIYLTINLVENRFNFIFSQNIKMFLKKLLKLMNIDKSTFIFIYFIKRFFKHFLLIFISVNNIFILDLLFFLSLTWQFIKVKLFIAFLFYQIHILKN